jgi:hypothetical protein
MLLQLHINWEVAKPWGQVRLTRGVELSGRLIRGIAGAPGSLQATFKIVHSFCGPRAWIKPGTLSSRILRAERATIRGVRRRAAQRRRISRGDRELPRGVSVKPREAVQTRLNRSGMLFFNPLAIFSTFTSDTFLIPRSTPL